MLKYVKKTEKFNLDLLWNYDLNLKTSTSYVYLQQWKQTTVALCPCTQQSPIIQMKQNYRQLSANSL